MEHTTPPPELRYVYTTTFQAVHYIRQLAATHPEGSIHGHTYEARFGFEGDTLYGVDFAPGEMDAADIIDPWIAQYLHRMDLIGMDFPTTPTRLAAYLWEAFADHFVPSGRTTSELVDVTLVVDGRAAYTYRPAPKATG